MNRFLLLILCLTATACTPADHSPEPERLATGTWSGGLTPMNHPDMVTPLSYEVGYEGDALGFTLSGPDDTVVPTRDVTLHGDTLRFVFDEPEESVTLQCALARDETGTFEGRCTDADGKWARFTMTPPN